MLDAQAEEINRAIRETNPSVFEMLSDRGRRIFFPTKGILAQTAEAKGMAINATIGTALEDDGGAMELPSLRTQVDTGIKDPFNYAPNMGLPGIRNAWKKMLFEKNPSLAASSNVSVLGDSPKLPTAGVSLPIVTAALTHGLSAAGALFIDNGDKIILPDLFWENYNLVFNYAYGSEFDTFPMFNDADGFNTAGLRRKLLDGPVGKKIVILNFPNNPTGYTVTEDEARAVRDIIVEAAEIGNNVVVIIDDAYFGLVFEDGILRESMWAFLAHAHERVLAVKVDGPTKEDYAWGMRVGFVTFGCAKHSKAFYGALESKLGGSIRGSVSSSSNISQVMLQMAYQAETYGREKAEKFEILSRRYKRIKEILDANKETYGEYLRPLPFNSGYFMCLEVKSGKAEEVRKVLLEKYNTGVIALGSLLRVAFSSTPFELLDNLFDNIYNAVREV